MSIEYIKKKQKKKSSTFSRFLFYCC